LAAAAIVVTEIRTPTKAPNLAEVSASMPAIPGRKTTIRESASGFSMKLVNGRSALNVDSLRSPRAVIIYLANEILPAVTVKQPVVHAPV
jgi:hypothetical protein